MKRTCIVLLVSLLSAAPAAVEAQFTYTTNADDTLTITNYSGGAVVAIPATIDGLTVADIGTNAFSASEVVSVTIPTNIVNIETAAFGACSSLTNVTLPASLTNLGNFAFIACSSLISVAIPSNVISIGQAAFQNCSSLTTLTIAKGVTSIGDNAFTACSKLRAVTIPGSVTNIGGDLFEACTALIDVDLGNGVPNVGVGMFLSDANMNGITIPNSVTNIGDYAFASTALANVTLPTNLTSIGNYAFALAVLTNLTLPTNLTSIGNGAFSQTLIPTLTIPASVTNIGENVFSLCANLTNITVAAQNSFYSSVNGVLFDISQDTLVAYPNALGGTYSVPGSVQNIEEGAFAGCNLASVTIASSVTNLGEFAFYDSTNLVTLFFEGNAPTTDPTAFQSDTNAVIYYLPGATGWSSPFAGLPAVLAEVVTWPNPAPIIYSAPLTSNQLNATADVPGSFAYSPANGSVLDAGAHTLSVIFTPSNTVYYSSVTNTVSLVVSPASLTITANSTNKTYGTTLAFAGTEFTASGLTNGDTVASVTLASAGAAATAAVSGSPYVIVPSAALPASLTNNYVLHYQNGQLTVNSAQVAIASGLTANNKFYNGTTTATLSSNNVVLSGIVAGDAVSLNTNGYLANFASASVGQGIAVTVSCLTLSGASAGNYILTQPTSLTANIISSVPPGLQILASQPNVVLSWSTNAIGFVLRQTASLSRPVTWSPVTNSITVNGTNNTVTIKASSGVQYFELMGTE